jgi:hypothetical protein
MLITPTYPCVYIEEVPSWVRMITGVATSITVFIGRALRRPADEPVTIFSFGDFERQFGGLWVDSMMSYQDKARINARLFQALAHLFDEAQNGE